MALAALQISRVRNLRKVELQGFQGVNVLYGLNGSGKTSVLEAIHLLGMARSFRGNSVKSLITHGENDCTVFGTSERSSQTQALALGVQRTRVGEARIKVGGEPVRTVAALAEHLPLQVITADSFDLLTGAPGARRRYLDWGVFHVEQRFFGQWKRFQRCIKQRNNLLRRGKVSGGELDAWTRDLAQTGTAINEYREAYFEALRPVFSAIIAQLSPSLEGLELRYQRGWDKQLGYAEALAQGLTADEEHGYTHTGPQRADIRVMSGAYAAADILSRGQQKLAVCALKLSQGQILAQKGHGSSTYLIDDLPSELDQVHSKRVCNLLATMEAQVFITCIDPREIRSVWPEGHDLAMFHVEQGSVGPCSDAQ